MSTPNIIRLIAAWEERPTEVKELRFVSYESEEFQVWMNSMLPSLVRAMPEIVAASLQDLSQGKGGSYPSIHPPTTPGPQPNIRTPSGNQGTDGIVEVVDQTPGTGSTSEVLTGNPAVDYVGYNIEVLKPGEQTIGKVTTNLSTPAPPEQPQEIDGSAMA